MTVDRPQVGGGKIPVAPGTCEACVWGRGPHTCQKMWRAADPGMVFFISPRRGTDYIMPDGTVYRVLEPEAEWLRRCAVIKNISGGKE